MNQHFTINTRPMNISYERIADLLCIAFEGDMTRQWAVVSESRKPSVITALWCEAFTYTTEKGAKRYYKNYVWPLCPDGYIMLEDEEAGTIHKLDILAIQFGLQKFYDDKKYAHCWRNCFEGEDTSDADAVDADVFVQFCCFGEVIYG